MRGSAVLQQAGLGCVHWAAPRPCACAFCGTVRGSRLAPCIHHAAFSLVAWFRAHLLHLSVLSSVTALLSGLAFVLEEQHRHAGECWSMPTASPVPEEKLRVWCSKCRALVSARACGGQSQRWSLKKMKCSCVTALQLS